MYRYLKYCAFCCISLFSVTAMYPQSKLSRVEYYIDTDPGYGKARSLNITQSTNLSNLTAKINPDSVSVGVHIFSVRAKNANGAWSLDNKWLFVKDVSAVSRPNIIRAEYYIDNDPGYGNARSITTAQGTNLSDLTAKIKPDSISVGVHIFGVRAKDANGAWSLDNKWLLVKDASAVSRPNIIRAEYYIDNDPGYGNARSITIAQGTNLSDLTAKINPDSVSAGVHIFGIRAKDSRGAWSLDNKWLFVKNVSLVATPKLKQVEYYVDTDPGYGKGVLVAIKDATNLSNVNLAVNISKLSAGDHKLFIRSKDAKNAWSLDNVFDFNVATAISTTSIVLNSVSRRTVCPPDTIKIAYQVKGTYNPGNIFKVQMSDASGSFTLPLVIGSYTGTNNSIITCAIPSGLSGSSRYKLRVVSTDPAVTGITSADSITVKTTHPAPTITPSGTVSICSGSSASLTATSGFSAYLWNSGQTSSKITVSTAGTYKVKVTDADGCTGSSKPDTVIIIKKPDSAYSISGADTVTSGQANVTYKVTAVTGLTYTWTVPSDATITSGQGTASIKVTWGSASGLVTVKASNTCGTSATKQFAVAVTGTFAAKGLHNQRDEEVIVYPNPASNTATVVFTTKSAEKYLIEVKDIAGKALLNKTGTSLPGTNRISLDINKFINGMYLINITDSQNRTRSLKLNKQGL